MRPSAVHEKERIVGGGRLLVGDALEARPLEIGAHEGDVSTIVSPAPDGDSLRRETAVRERDDERAARPEHAADVGEDLERTDQVLDADRADDGREGLVRKTEARGRD